MKIHSSIVAATVAFASFAFLLAGCKGDASPARVAPAQSASNAASTAPHDHDAATNGPSRALGDEPDHDHDQAVRSIAVPESVRRNLGITFARVERRPVASTIRVPGRFELLPKARREYRTMLAGRVEIFVNHLDRVEPGTPLYRLDSPPWREVQEELNEADAAVRQAQVRSRSLGPVMSAHRDHAAALEENVSLWMTRVEQLEQGRGRGVVTADEFTAAQTALATNRADLAELREKAAELSAQQEELEFELEAARARMKLLIETASTLLGLDEAELIAPCTPESHESAGVAHQDPADAPSPLWREIDRITVRASAAGVVENLALANGAWASDTSLVLSIIQPDQVRFCARGMQSDLGRLASGLPARIVPPAGSTVDFQETMAGELVLGLAADPDERTIELLVTPREVLPWARAGVSAYVEIIVAGGEEELAVPASAVVQDGLEKVVFRRDPHAPDTVQRIPAELGVSDGRWVVVKHGVQAGDEVVLDGVYQLMLATAGTAQQGGHFDPDGTFHTGKH